MYYFKFFTTTLLVLFASFSFAQSNPEIYVESKSDTYDLMMKLEESKSIASVSVKGYNFDKKNNQNFEIKFSYKELFKKNDGVILLQELNKNTDFMFCTVYIEDTDGKIKTLPSKKVFMPSENISSN